MYETLKLLKSPHYLSYTILLYKSLFYIQLFSGKINQFMGHLLPKH